MQVSHFSALSWDHTINECMYILSFQIKFHFSSLKLGFFSRNNRTKGKKLKLIYQYIFMYRQSGNVVLEGNVSCMEGQKFLKTVDRPTFDPVLDRLLTSLALPGLKEWANNLPTDVFEWYLV